MAMSNRLRFQQLAALIHGLKEVNVGQFVKRFFWIGLAHRAVVCRIDFFRRSDVCRLFVAGNLAGASAVGTFDGPTSYAVDFSG